MKSSRALAHVVLTGIIAVAAGTQQGCQDIPTAPASRLQPPVAEAINAPGSSDAPEIIFLAPLGPKHHPRGELDTTLTPSLSICRLSGDSCGADTLAHITSNPAIDSAHRINLSERAFYYRWKIKDIPTDTTIAYRVVVTLGDTTVGFTDLKIVEPDYKPDPKDTLQFAFIARRNWLKIRFQIFMPPTSLTVIAEPGVHGNLQSQTYSFRRGERVAYDFAADSGYNSVLVTLDQNPIGRHGKITMDGYHVLVASADRKTDIVAGDEWILRDARSLLKARDKVKAAQQLLDEIDEMTDTINIADRLRRVEMTVLKRDADAASMPELDAALAGHDFDVSYGDGSIDDTPGGGGGGGSGGGGVTASSLFVPLGSATRLGSSSNTLMSNFAAPSENGAEPVTIVYVNGILTTPLGALFAAHHVAVAARSAHWNSNVAFDVKLLYNRSAIAGSATKEERCVLELGIKGDWLGLNSLPGEVAKCLNSTEPKALAVLADYAEAGSELASVLQRSAGTRPHDVDTVAAFTTRMRDQGKHVVFVMHSQGNLIVQQALTLLKTRGKYNQSHDTTCIGGVALASPTSEAWPISDRHLHGLVVDGDAILMLGSNHFPQVHTPMSDSAAQEMTGSIRARIRGLLTAAGIRWGVRLHSAIQSYLTPEPIRSRIQDAIVSSYRGCALGEVNIAPQGMELRTGETGTFHAGLTDMDGDPLDGRRGLDWQAESLSDWQRAVELSSSGAVKAHYVGGTTVSAVTRSIAAHTGVEVSPAPLTVSATEKLSAIWALLYFGGTAIDPTRSFETPSVGWDGGSCTEKATIVSNGITGTFSKQCSATYLVTTQPFPLATSYQASFFERNATAALFTKSASRASLVGSIAGPEATLDLLPGPNLFDRIVMTSFDGAGHMLARGVACVHGCAGWPPEL
jgi:hypothetical protein